MPKNLKPVVNGEPLVIFSYKSDGIREVHQKDYMGDGVPKKKTSLEKRVIGESSRKRGENGRKFNVCMPWCCTHSNQHRDWEKGEKVKSRLEGSAGCPRPPDRPAGHPGAFISDTLSCRPILPAQPRAAKKSKEPPPLPIPSRGQRSQRAGEGAHKGDGDGSVTSHVTRSLSLTLRIAAHTSMSPGRTHPTALPTHPSLGLGPPTPASVSEVQSEPVPEAGLPLLREPPGPGTLGPVRARSAVALQHQFTRSPSGTPTPPSFSSRHLNNPSGSSAQEI
uniref:Uncharacterized protein LOC110200857 n=1 Tax=Phascolarctos cinereus TaxID=38626 RepID=A0A6P5JL46_PHACI|nr:uncharacterized protein LOC110200857 [Phascolarctos cinereus]